MKKQKYKTIANSALSADQYRLHLLSYRLMVTNRINSRRVGLLLLLSLSNCSGPTESYISSFFETGDRIESHAIIDNDILYFGSNDKTFYAVDIHNGAERWSFPTGSAIKSSAVIKDSIVYFSSGNRFYALDRKDGSIVNFSLIGGNVFTDPLVHEDHIYMGSDDRHIYAIDLPVFLSDSVTLMSRRYESIDRISISPNPFLDSTIINFKVNYETSVKATIYDLDRKVISILHDGPLSSGNHPFIWDGKDSLGTLVPAGYYIIEAGSREYFKSAFIQLNR